MTNIAEQKTSRRSSAVVVLFHGPEERETAVSFCDRLIARFWTSCQFDIQWWGFHSLPNQEAARQAHQAAVEADLVVFAPAVHHDIPAETREWIERWMDARCSEREGSLAVLLPPEPQHRIEAAHRYFRKVARRAGMDFLTELPESVDQPIPDSIESYTQRAQCVTGVLDEILHRPARPLALHP
jgi:hypothetical protein